MARAVLPWIAILAVYVAVRVPLVSIPLQRDEGGFAYMGEALLRGEVPYRDFADHKPPGVVYVMAGLLAVAPHTAHGVHVALHLYNLLTLVGMYRLGSALAGSRAAGLWTAFLYGMVSASSAVEGFSAGTEMLGLLPLAWSLVSAVHAGRRTSASAALVTGALAAAAASIKPTLLLPALTGLAWMAWDGERGRRAMLAAWWLLGGLLVAALLLAPLAAQGVAREAWYWSFTHNREYAARVSPWVGVLLSVFLLPAFLLENAVVALAGVPVLGSGPQARRLGAFLGLSWLATVPGFYTHYLAQLAPALALAGGIGAQALVARPAGALARRMAGGALVAAALAVPALAAPGYYFGRGDDIARARFQDNPFPESPGLADFLRSRTTEADCLLVLGSEPQVPFLAGRRSCTRFIFAYPLFQRFTRQREFQEVALREIRATRPRYVVVVQVRTSTLADGPESDDFVRAVGEILARDYELEAVQDIGLPVAAVRLVSEVGPQPSYPIRILRRRDALPTP